MKSRRVRLGSLPMGLTSMALSRPGPPWLATSGSLTGRGGCLGRESGMINAACRAILLHACPGERPRPPESC